jgi:cytoskeleton protein RodZ
MQSLGMRLRQEREKRHIPLQKIAEETKISARYLEALEADDLSGLPGEFFYRAFVRQYSRYLGFDPEAIDRDINVVSSKPVVEEGVPTVATAAPDPQISALQETLRDKPLRAAQDVQDSGMSKAWLGFAAAVILACGGYYAWKNFSAAPASEPVQTASAPVPPQPAQTEPAITTSQPATPQPATPQALTPPPTAVETTPTPQPASSATTPATTTPATGQFSLTVVAKEMTWIRITADGSKVYGGTIDAGQQRTINAKDAEVIVGNAGTLDVIYNGKPLQYGAKGEVKTLLFNPEGWKYKPKPVAPVTPPATTSMPQASIGNAGLGGV